MGGKKMVFAVPKMPAHLAEAIYPLRSPLRVDSHPSHTGGASRAEARVAEGAGAGIAGVSKAEDPDARSETPHGM
jgi:hypothetical protein